MRKVVKVGNQILRQKAKPVGKITPEIKKLVSDMVEAMNKSKPKGVGIAAPQVGVGLRIIVVKAGENDICLVNPEVVKKEGEIVLKEGCLSVPGLYAEIKRPEKVTCRFKSLGDKKGELECEGFLARIILHEIDHLNGVLFIDYITPGQELDLDEDAVLPDELVSKIMKENIHQLGETL